MNYIVATSRKWNEDVVSTLSSHFNNTHNFTLITQPSELNIQRLQQMAPQFIFFFHWSTIIPADIYQTFNCVIFHMTDLPYGRGGSPLQNLIARGHKKTKISAIKCTETLDGGPVYLKKELSLDGAAKDIFARAKVVIEKMVIEMIQTNITPIEQQGEIVVFNRRKPDDGNLKLATGVAQVYDYIRMLDAEGYPKAYLDVGDTRFEFDSAQLMGDEVFANVRIKKK